MKTILCAVLLLVSMTRFAAAHPPKNIETKIAGDKADINVIHNVKNPSDHYIKIVKITLNKKPLVVQDFYIQGNASGQAASYIIPSMKKGDTLVIEAECNKMGKLEKKFTVE